jgi:hypothetical protein
MSNPFEKVGPVVKDVVVPNNCELVIVRKEFNIEVKNNIKNLENELMQINGITSQASAQAANIVLKKAKQLVKSLSAERMQMTSILDDKKSEIMQYEKSIVENITNLIAIINNNIVLFQIEEDRKAKEAQEKIEKQRREELARVQQEQKRVAEIKTTILDFERNVLNAIQVSTISDIDEKINHLLNFKLSSEIYQEFINDAQIVYQDCVAKFNIRKTELLKLQQLEKENAEAAYNLKLQQQQQFDIEKKQQDQKEENLQNEIKDNVETSISNIQMTSELQTSMIEKAKGVTKRWSVEEETIDLSLLPDEYKCADLKKIKEAISAGCREIPGVNIYEKIINTSR